MKKTLAIVGSVVLLSILVGCAQYYDSATPSSNPSAPTTQSGPVK